MNDLLLPIGMDLRAEWPNEDLYGLSSLPYKCVSPTYKADIDVLIGEKVHSYKFETITGEIVVRDATLDEYLLGQKMRKAVYD